MELQVTITLTDRLFGLLEEKLPNLGRRVEKAITKELGALARSETNTEISVVVPEGGSLNPGSEAPVFKPTPEFFETGNISAKAQDLEQGADVRQASPKPFAEAPVEKPEKEPTPEDVRAAIDRARKRFIGENYKENTAGEAYKRYYKPLSDQFKMISRVLGYDKPSSLPPEHRAAFIAECDALIIGEDGNITTPPAPY